MRREGQFTFVGEYVSIIKFFCQALSYRTVKNLWKRRICQKTKYEATMFAILMSFHNIAGQGSDLLGSWLYQYTGFFWLVVISTVTTFMVLPVIKQLEEA